MSAAIERTEKLAVARGVDVSECGRLGLRWVRLDIGIASPDRGEGGADDMPGTNAFFAEVSANFGCGPLAFFEENFYAIDFYDRSDRITVGEILGIANSTRTDTGIEIDPDAGDLLAAIAESAPQSVDPGAASEDCGTLSLWFLVFHGDGKFGQNLVENMFDVDSRPIVRAEFRSIGTELAAW